MDELADKCQGFASQIFRSGYQNTYDHPARSLASCYNWGVSRRAADEWRALAPDVVHLNKQNLEDSLDLVRALSWSALPGVCTVHLTQTAKYLGAKGAWLRDWVARWHLSRFGGILVGVQDERSAMLDQFLAGHAQTRTVFNGVPAVAVAAPEALRQAKRRELGLQADDVLVLGLGRLVAQKRPFEFLRIAEQLKARVPAARFVWVGDGELAESWRAAVTRAGLEDVISCVGWQEDVSSYLLAGDLLLHVAQFEGFPLGLIEAMAAGLPCAITRELSREIPFLNEENVLYADDIEALAAQTGDRAARLRIAARARELFEAKLSLAKMTESYEAVYLDAIRSMESRHVHS
jgi:glycosyltransferase involved in cell wall biosynthesis